MAVAYDASSESHTGTAGSTTLSYSWTHTPTGSPKGVLVFTFTNGVSTDSALAVSYGKYGLAPISGGRAVDTAGEPGDCKAWLLSPWSYRFAVSTAATSGTASGLTGATYGNGYWVASGASGALVYKTTDPSGSWSAATSGTGSNLVGVGYGGSYFVACGSSGAIIYKATDPTGSWSSATSGVAGLLQSVAYGNGYYAAAGANGVIRYKASDPTGSWSGATSGSTEDFYGVAYGDGYWVTVGTNGTILYKATDPTGSWSAATSGTGNLLRAVTYANGYWVAVGDSVILYKSGSDPSGSWSTASTTGNKIDGVAYGDGYWVTFANAPRYVKGNPDGTWINAATTVSHASLTGGGTYGGGYFLNVGSSGAINYGEAPGEAPLAIPTGAQTVVTTTTSGNNDSYSVAITVTADYGVEATGVVLQQGDQTLANTAVDDGSPGTDSVRFAGLFSGLSAVPSANAGSTELQNIDFGNQVVSVIRETTAGQGSRSIGWTGASDDVAAVYLAIREAIVPWTVGVPIR